MWSETQMPNVVKQRTIRVYTVKALSGTEYIKHVFAFCIETTGECKKKFYVNGPLTLQYKLHQISGKRNQEAEWKMQFIYNLKQDPHVNIISVTIQMRN